MQCIFIPTQKNNPLLPEHPILRCYVYLLSIRNNSILLIFFYQQMHFYLTCKILNIKMYKFDVILTVHRR